jgi:recombining binding protein (suppressor of hairless)
VRTTDADNSSTVAQKSYKSEKRYLCPPPMVRLDGPMRHLAQKPRLVLSVLSETGVRNMSEEASSVDEEMKTYFRGLYVAGTAKAKAISFQLTLHPPGNPLAPPDINSGADETLASGPSFACFDSATVSILSKACKKTAKARNTTGCLLAGSTLSLFNRINSQAVRTKYMTIDAGKFTARTSQWTAFSIHVLRSAEVALPGGAGTLATSKVFNGANTVTYGSQIILTDLMTGISSEPMTIRHVEKNKVHLGATGPVSQLQKIALVRTTATGQDIYLSVEEAGGMDATGVLLSTPQVEQPEEENGTEPGKKKKKGKEVPSPLLAMLTYQYPDQVLSAEENGGVSCHVVKDQMTWTVVGICE